MKDLDRLSLLISTYRDTVEEPLTLQHTSSDAVRLALPQIRGKRRKLASVLETGPDGTE